jgi:phosphoglycerate dehydrogenase-like enzyme
MSSSAPVSIPNTGTPRSQRLLKAAVVVRPQHLALIYPAAEIARAAAVAEILNPEGPLDPERWPEVEVLLGGWGIPVLDEAFLREAEALRAVFYAAGSVRCFMTDAAWRRGITISTAADANSATTAEFCLGQILFSLKHGWRFMRDPREAWRTAYQHQAIPGLYGSRIGLVSFGRVARRLATLLKPLPLEVVAWDPIQPDEVLLEHGVKRCDLETLFATSHVVSLHAPLVPETEKLAGAALLNRLRPGATLINTSRGEVVDEPALIDLLRRRPDLTAVLDVTHPEPPRPSSPLFDLPNVVLTPHIAGCYGPECRRLGALAVDELTRYVEGKPLLHSIDREEAEVMA